MFSSFILILPQRDFPFHVLIGSGHYLWPGLIGAKEEILRKKIRNPKGWTGGKKSFTNKMPSYRWLSLYHILRHFYKRISLEFHFMPFHVLDPHENSWKPPIQNLYKISARTPGLPDHCIFGAKSSLVSSSKQWKQKANTKKNKEHC